MYKGIGPIGRRKEAGNDKKGVVWALSEQLYFLLRVFRY